MKRWRVVPFVVALSLLGVLLGCGGSSQPAPSPPPPPQQDFALSLSVNSVFVPLGIGSGTVQISVQAVNGFNQSATVSFSGLPNGVSTSPALPVMVSPGTNATITLSAASGTTIGVQKITVQATSGTLSHTASFSLSIANPSYAYLPTGYPNQPPYDLVGFAVDANTGALSQVPGSPVSLSATPVDVAVASETGGAFVFALIPDSASGTVTLQSYSVDAATGALTPLQTISYPPNAYQSLLAVHPSGKFLYVMEAGCLLAYSIDPATGNLTQASCSSSLLNFGPGQSFIVAPPGGFGYQSQSIPFPASTLYVYSINETDGSVTLQQSIPDSGPGPLLTDPQGRALYELGGPLGPGFCGFVTIWAIDPSNGGLTNLNTSFSPKCEDSSITFNPADTFAYAIGGANPEINSPNGIFGGAVGSDGNLTTIPGSPFGSNLGSAFAGVEASQGGFLLDATSTTSSGQVLVYAINPSTGAVSQVSGVQGTLPSKFYYVFKMLTVAPNH
jgi:hypothetical protein